MAGWDKCTVKGKTKDMLIRLKKENKLSENDIIEYALLQTFKKRK